MKSGLWREVKRYNFCPKKSSGLPGRHSYVHNPQKSDEAGTRNVARFHSPTREVRAICLANRKRSEPSKTEDTEAFCLETIKPLGLHAALSLQEAGKMANTADKRNLCIRVLILSKS